LRITQAKSKEEAEERYEFAKAYYETAIDNKHGITVVQLASLRLAAFGKEGEG
jgi:hypothetical protein